MEAVQALDLPWISELSPEEVMVLRREATAALPQFREYLISRIAAAQDERSVISVIGELRESSARVAVELEASRRRWFTRTSLATGAVGLSIVLFAAAPAQAFAVAALAAALAALSGTHSHVVTDVADEHKLKSTPGYVLLKAKDILKHT